MKYYAYVSIAGEDKISIFKMNPETGKLLQQGDFAVSSGPSPLAVDPESRFLYVGLRFDCRISSLRIDQDTGDLSPIGMVSLDADPCYLATDRRGRFLLSSYHKAGKVIVHPIGENGAVSEQAVALVSTSAHPHSVQTDPSNKFVFVPHTVPSNAIFQFHFNENTGVLTSSEVPKVIPATPAGPRHFLFHPYKDIVYTSNEQGCSVTAYHFDPSVGILDAAFQTVSTLPEGYDGKNICAQIHITPSGKFLYVSNRGHDSIACFSIDDITTGKLTNIGQQLTEPTPRVFNIDPTGNFLFAAGQFSGRLAAYRIDANTGELKPLETYPVGKRVMWVLILSLPG